MQQHSGEVHLTHRATQAARRGAITRGQHHGVTGAQICTGGGQDGGFDIDETYGGALSAKFRHDEGNQTCARTKRLQPRSGCALDTPAHVLSAACPRRRRTVWQKRCRRRQNYANGVRHLRETTRRFGRAGLTLLVLKATSSVLETKRRRRR